MAQFVHRFAGHLPGVTWDLCCGCKGKRIMSGRSLKIWENNNIRNIQKPQNGNLRGKESIPSAYLLHSYGKNCPVRSLMISLTSEVGGAGLKRKLLR